MFSDKLNFIGILEKGKPFYIRNCDITKYKSEPLYKNCLFSIKKLKKSKDIYIKVLQISYTDAIIYGERNIDDKCEIYEVKKQYEEKLKKQFFSFAMHFYYENRLKHYLSFLWDNYGFKYMKTDLGNLVDKDSKLVYYGPLYAYSIYNEDFCINILNLVQRHEYSIYITDEYKPNQIYIENGIRDDYNSAENLREFAEYLQISINSTGKIYGHKILL